MRLALLLCSPFGHIQAEISMWECSVSLNRGIFVSLGCWLVALTHALEWLWCRISVSIDSMYIPALTVETDKRKTPLAQHLNLQLLRFWVRWCYLSYKNSISNGVFPSGSLWREEQLTLQLTWQLNLDEAVTFSSSRLPEFLCDVAEGTCVPFPFISLNIPLWYGIMWVFPLPYWPVDSNLAYPPSHSFGPA